MNQKLYIEYLEEILLINEKKENFFCASRVLLKKIQILEDNFEEDYLFENIGEETYQNSLENFSYKNALIQKKEKKFYILVNKLVIFFKHIIILDWTL